MEKYNEQYEDDTQVVEPLKLVLWNDDVSSFELVILSLIKVLGWDQMAAEQMAYLAHHRGRVSLKSGEYLELEKYKYGLEEMGLTVTIE